MCMLQKGAPHTLPFKKAMLRNSRQTNPAASRFFQKRSHPGIAGGCWLPRAPELKEGRKEATPRAAPRGSHPAAASLSAPARADSGARSGTDPSPWGGGTKIPFPGKPRLLRFFPFLPRAGAGAGCAARPRSGGESWQAGERSWRWRGPSRSAEEGRGW